MSLPFPLSAGDNALPNNAVRPQNESVVAEELGAASFGFSEVHTDLCVDQIVH